MVELDELINGDITNIPSGTTIRNPHTNEVLSIQEKLGQGGEGHTYLSKNADGVERVLKFVERSNGTSTEELEDKLSSELRRVNTLLGANYSAFAINSLNVGIVGDFAEGRNLEKEIIEGNKAYTESEVIDFLTKVCTQFLEPLHNGGVVHKDIKPQNIIVNSDREYTLIDFGTIRSVNDLATMTVTMRGTPGYSRIKSKHEVSDDFYSLAKTAYFLFTGRHPEFIGHDEYDRMEDEKKFNALRIDENLKNVLWKMLGHDNTYDNVDSLLGDLRKLQVNSDESKVDVRSARELAKYREASIVPSDLQERITGFKELFFEKYEDKLAERVPIEREDKDALVRILQDLGYTQQGEVYVRPHKSTEHIDVISFEGDNYAQIRHGQVYKLEDAESKLDKFEITDRFYELGTFAGFLSPIITGIGMGVSYGDSIPGSIGCALIGAVAGFFTSDFLDKIVKKSKIDSKDSALWGIIPLFLPHAFGKAFQGVENGVRYLSHASGSTADSYALENALHPLPGITYDKNEK